MTRIQALVTIALFGASALALSACATTKKQAEFTPSAEIIALQDRLLTLDTHLDTPALLLRKGWSIDREHSVDQDGTDVDLPRMKKGGLDGGFWAIYTRQGPRTVDGYLKARTHALRTADAIEKMIADDPANFELALAADDAPRIAAAGKRVVFISMENSFPLGSTPEALETSMQEFYGLGVRLISPVHMTNNDLADSATDPKGAEWNGLSPLGKQFVAEANQLGMVLDASHASDAVFDQMLELSKAPIILSHSGVSAVHKHPRNIDDARLRKLAKTGGVIQMNALSAYLVDTPKSLERDTALAAMYAKYDFENLTARQGETLTKERARIDEAFPVPKARFDDYMAQVLHALKVAGVDHVGIGADWDGGGGVTGMEDVSLIWRITERLHQEGYSEEDLQKIWSGNVLRVLKAAEAERDKEARH
ncbi:MAG: dipeptidase [Caulobacterales bacterium]